MPSRVCVYSIAYISKEYPSTSPTDFIFPDIWGSFRYIKAGANPFSYIYRSGYTAACRFFKKKIIERNKSAEINEHLAECLSEYREDSSDGRVYNVNFD